MKVFAIAINTFKEAIRNKILFTIIFFALLMMGASIILNNVTIGQQAKIIKDMGLASINIFGILIAIFVGIGLVYKEIDKKTIYTIISKPIHRYEFLIGKYLGLVITLITELIFMTMVFFLIILIYENGIQFNLLSAIFLILIELMVVTSVGIFFSSFSTPILSGLFTLSFYIIGHLTSDLKALGKISENRFTKNITEILYYIIPNLENFNIKADVVYQLPVSSGYILWAAIYGMIYITLILFLSVLIFQWRDFK
ncbi:MAG: ABC transporter permease [Nitrospirota bacterium]